MINTIFTKILLFSIFINKIFDKMKKHKDLINIFFVPVIALLCLIPAIFGKLELSTSLFYLFFIIMVLIFIVLSMIIVASMMYERLFNKNVIPTKNIEIYKKEIQAYAQNHANTNYLENEHCKLLFHYLNQHETVIRLCNNQKNYKIIEISTEKHTKADKELLATLWLIIQTYFNKNTTIIGILIWILQIENFWVKNNELLGNIKIYEI